MKVVWDLISDQKTFSLLKDVNREVDEDVSRLLFIDLLRRIKSLEVENLAMQVLLEEMGVMDGELFKETCKAVRDFLKTKDDQKKVESEFFSASGIPFTQWVNFTLKGSFDGSGAEN